MNDYSIEAFEYEPRTITLSLISGVLVMIKIDGMEYDIPLLRDQAHELGQALIDIAGDDSVPCLADGCWNPIPVAEAHSVGRLCEACRG